MQTAALVSGGTIRYLEEIRRFLMLEAEEESVLAKRWREHGDRDAAHKLVTSHLRLVAKLAVGYRGYGLPISEVISEGNIGLMQAAKRFDPQKGFRFATYAMWWIKAAIQEYILRSWSLVKMGTTANQKKLFFNLRKAKSKISALEEGDLRPDQVKLIAQRLGVTEQDVIDMNRRLGGDISLNAPIRDDVNSGEWQDWLVDEASDQETRLAESEQLENRKKALGEALAVLGQRERRTARRRPDHARGFGGGVRHLARARASDRGARLPEGAAGGANRDRRQAAFLRHPLTERRARRLCGPPTVRAFWISPYDYASTTLLTSYRSHARYIPILAL
jgi:RNA polymerase sigma-32 factor